MPVQPRWMMRLWRGASLAFAVASTIGAVFMFVFVASGAGLAFTVSAGIFWLNYLAVRNGSRILERRRERLENANQPTDSQ